MSLLPSEKAILWIVIFIMGWALFMHLPVMFPTMTAFTLNLTRTAVSSLNIFVFVMIMNNALEEVNSRKPLT